MSTQTIRVRLPADASAMSVTMALASVAQRMGFRLTATHSEPGITDIDMVPGYVPSNVIPMRRSGAIKGVKS
ncbi:MAG: hypothetical protein CMK46_07110 [Porticoccus sp.]|jgi:hypothetical protein|uniref:hypothetical protein n=1 Tax=Pseudomonadota TaxID=1224 RepID=UPI000C4B18FD|nr:hypothetical protein [Rhodospirillaceae bacterium]MAY26221.1 hypothetical protein [Polycyclovorans sp.]MBG57977.1 hypothetical protein [Porticoccus sp.]QDP49919.1 MAG: hypothetical protein GOVbin132_63 [Prokaryotic dsDNA virus sp.]MAX61584.1 hypothetical protein [Rhodospirillaceae bacterium]|tara:strand:- start:6997 stop:7212 length:216 start_codon:yes stop_codon:yes gene_type:complete